MICENLLSLRKLNRMTQEDVAEQIGVSRQAVAKWESGETLPDIEKSRSLARLFNVSLDELIDYDPKQTGMPIPPRGKYLFGIATIGDKGQIVIPKKARKIFGLKPGDRMIVLGDEAQGLALIKEEGFLALMDALKNTGGNRT